MIELLTSVERIARILKHQPVDRIGASESFWQDTDAEWRRRGIISPTETINAHLNLDIDMHWTFQLVADLDKKPVVISETEDTITLLDGNGATLRRHKKHDTTPEHVDFLVKERPQWEAYIKPILKPDPRRIDFEGYRKLKEKCRQDNRFFMWCGLNVFECMAPVAGHENMLVGMALDPAWILDMTSTYADLTIALMEILFEKEGKPDGIFFYEDLGFKERPFMSPAMYKELLQPAHKKTIAYAKSLGLPVIMHSCGFVEPLLPYMIEAGIDCLQAMEVKAGMDVLRIYKNYGERIALMGGIDTRGIISNEKTQIDAELTKKIPILKEGYGYILHSDHSIPVDVKYETYQYFLKKALALGTYHD